MKNCDGLASHSGKSRDSPGPNIQPIANWRFTRLEGRHYTHPFLPLLERNTKHFLTVHSYLTILDRQELKWEKEIRKDRSRFSEKKSGQLDKPLLSCSRIWRGSHGFALTGISFTSQLKRERYSCHIQATVSGRIVWYKDSKWLHTIAELLTTAHIKGRVAYSETKLVFRSVWER